MVTMDTKHLELIVVIKLQLKWLNDYRGSYFFSFNFCKTTGVSVRKEKKVFFTKKNLKYGKTGIEASQVLQELKQNCLSRVYFCSSTINQNISILVVIQNF